jgi:hypothetical protein
MFELLHRQLMKKFNEQGPRQHAIRGFPERYRNPQYDAVIEDVTEFIGKGRPVLFGDKTFRQKPLELFAPVAPAHSAATTKCAFSPNVRCKKYKIVLSDAVRKASRAVTIVRNAQIFELSPFARTEICSHQRDIASADRPTPTAQRQ